MRTRKFYEEIVNEPGKFEKDPRYVPYFYDLYLDGEGEYISRTLHRIKITDEDIARFPELKGKRYIYLVFSELGFVDGYAE